MKNKIILIIGLLSTPFISKADTSCIGFTSIDQVTSVSTQHPLRYVNCPCNCSERPHLEDSCCVMCDHKHGDSQIIQTAKTNGHFINFMLPTQATTSCPSCSNADWVEALVGYIETKVDTNLQKKELPITTVPYSESIE